MSKRVGYGCYGLKVCVLQKLLCLSPTFNVTVF